MKITDRQLKTIKKKAKKFDIEYLYLFGSQARGEAGPLSDFDFAVKFSTKVKDKFRVKLRLMGELEDIVKSEKLDLVDIQDTNPLMAFNIVKDGKILYSKNGAEVMDKAYAIKIFLDRRYYYDRHAKKAIIQMSEGKI